MNAIEIPADVTAWLNGVFSTCNERVTEKLCANPNVPEESLDLSWIEELSRHSTAVTLESDWTVRLRAHFLGGLRHWNGWEVADIGILLFIRAGGVLRRRKVALLQSKRLYPTNMAVSEESLIDYAIGFARLADPEDIGTSIAFETDFRFDGQCRYGALTIGSHQAAAIENFQRDRGLRIYYQFYNPWTTPFSQRVPLRGYVPPEGPVVLGVRIVPASTVHAIAPSVGRSPSLDDLAAAQVPDGYGWRLEAFISEELLSCREGNAFSSTSDDAIDGLFYRRSGAIAAAIGITIEGPEGSLGQFD
jgi:hypothetical protein